MVKMASADDFHDLYAEYNMSNEEEKVYEHDFLHQIMFLTTGNRHEPGDEYFIYSEGVLQALL